MIIQHHLPTMNLVNNMARREYRIAQSVQRVSSGRRINTAADDPAGMVRAESIKAKLRGIAAMKRAASISQANYDTQQSELMGRNDMLQRLRELSVQASSETFTPDQREILVTEFKGTLEELLERFQEHGGFEVRVDGDSGELYLSDGEKLYVDGEWTDTIPGGGISLQDAEIGTGKSAGETIGLMDYFLTESAMEGASLGALAAGISSQMEVMSQLEISLTEQLSRIEDADIAEEMIKYAKETVLQQASFLVLSHVKMQPETVLYLLEG